MTTTKNKERASEGIKKNQSLRKALQILEGMTGIPSPARLQDIARHLKIPQSTLLRFLNTFIDFGYVGQDNETSCYYLTLKLADLGSKIMDSFPSQNSLLKYIKQAAIQFNESVSLCIDNNMRIVYIATQDNPSRLLRTMYRPGHIAPMHASGPGKIHLLDYSDSKLKELEEKYGFKKYTDHTITTMESLQKEILQIKTQGYALDNEEYETGIRCVAVPVKNFQGKVAASIAISSPVTRLDEDRTNEIIQFLLGVSIEASKELGWTSKP